MNRIQQQSGFILLPVVLAITLIATIAFLINTESTINVDMTANTTAAAEVEQVARAGLAHATWGVQNSGCAGDMGMTTVPFGQGGTNSYTATVATGGATTSKYTFIPDHDGFIEEGATDHNHAGDNTTKVLNKLGNAKHALYHYDLSSIPSSQRVVTATAWFYVHSQDDEGTVTLHPVTAPWTEADLTWDLVGGRYDSTVYGSFPAQPVKDVWVPVNVTALAQSWVSNPAGNHGLLLKATSFEKESQYTSRENGTASQRPYLEVTTADAAVSPVTITANGTLAGNPSPANDITRTLTRTAVPAYQPPDAVTLQLGTDAGEDGMPDSFYDARNYGGADYLQVHSDASGWHQYPLIRFDLAGLPRGAAVRSARLELRLQSLIAPGTASIQQVTRSWVEGTKSGTGTADGATWFTHDGTSVWTSAGGDINAPVVAETAIDGSETWVGWEIAPLVERWLAGEPNHGLQIRPGNGLEQANFASKEDSTVGVQPKLTITYACECGRPCFAPQGSGTVLMVVINPTTLVPEDAAKKALFESWGYTVTVIGESENDAAYSSAIAAADVVYISETVNSSQVGTKLVNVPIGVITEDGLYNDDLGISNNAGVTTGTSLNIIDTSHYITGIFPSGLLDIYDADMEQLVVFNGPAPDLQTLAEVGGYSSLVTLEAGATLKGGATAAGRRAMLPLGRVANFNWDYLNSNGRLLVQRALQWGTGNVGIPEQKLLLVVGDATAPAGDDAERQTLMEGWGYTVTLIDDDDTQANFDAALAASDVAYVSSTVSDAALGTKLLNATIGVVNENMPLVATFGFADGYMTKSRDEIRVTDNSHYITLPLPTGYVPIFTSLQTMYLSSGSLGAVQVLADAFNTGTDANNKPSLMTLFAGDALSGGGTAAGRRVQLPWGDVTFDPASLNTDGLTIMQRAIEWAEGAGGTPAQSVLLVVSDAASLSSKESAVKALIESWGYTVTPISASASQADYDTALANVDVAYVSGTISSAELGSKLAAATVGVVSEDSGTLDDMGMAEPDLVKRNTQLINIVNNTHYVTSGLSSGDLAIVSSSINIWTASGALAPGLQVLGETQVAGTGYPPGVAVLETGAALWGGGSAAGRRVQVPWSQGDSSFDISILTADGLNILQRAIEWGAGASGSPQQILLVVADATSLTSQEAARKAQMESWGYIVTVIDDGDSQANFDAAVATADAAYVSLEVSATSLGTKLVDATIGVVSEHGDLIDDFGLASGSPTAVTLSNASIIDNTHYITDSFLPGDLTLVSAQQPFTYVNAGVAAGVQTLADVFNKPSLLVADTGAELLGSTPAPGRRVQLPWGSAGFDINALNTDALKIMQRAIEWSIGGGGGGGGGGPPPASPVFEEMTEAMLSSNGTSLAIAKPAGTAEGDLLVAVVATDGNNSGSLAPPAGWNVIHVDDRAGKVTLGVWWKQAGASESGSYTFNWSNGEHAYGWIMRVTGHDPISPINATANTAGRTASPESPSVTTTLNNTLILRLGGFDDSDITPGAPGLSGHATINMNDSKNDGSGDVSGGSGYVEQATAGISGTSSFALTGSEEYVTVTVAITPAL